MEFVFLLVMMSFLAFGTIYAIKKKAMKTTPKSTQKQCEFLKG